MQSVLITINAVSSNSSQAIQHYVIKFVSDSRQVIGFSPGTTISSTNKTDRHDITEILLKVALNTINLNPYYREHCIIAYYREHCIIAYYREHCIIAYYREHCIIAYYREHCIIAYYREHCIIAYYRQLKSRLAKILIFRSVEYLKIQGR